MRNALARADAVVVGPCEHPVRPDRVILAAEKVLVRVDKGVDRVAQGACLSEQARLWHRKRVGPSEQARFWRRKRAGPSEQGR